MNALALDIGDRYIGVAATDHTDPIAYRYTTIDRRAVDVFTELSEVLVKTGATTVVVGVPYHVEDGSETNQTAKTREFIASLRTASSNLVNIIEVDETLTSREAKQTLQTEGADSSQEHAEAARIILQEFLTHGI